MEHTQPLSAAIPAEDGEGSKKDDLSGKAGQEGLREESKRATQVELAREATKKAIEQGSIVPGQKSLGQNIISSEKKTGGRSSMGGSQSKQDAGKGSAQQEPIEINLRTLLEAGAHFGHQTSRWNPAMSPYIYGSRNGIHIINLPKTVQAWARAKTAIEEIAAQGGSFLFVGTKKQAQEAVSGEATRANSYFVAERWLGGMLTNFTTIRKSVERMKKLEETLQEEETRMNSGAPAKFTKKERLMFSRELGKLESSIGGVRDMTSLPSMLFVIDIRREEIAIKEARRLDIPVVAIVDTNCDPAAVPYAIPANDDGTRAITLFSRAVADAIVEGRKRYVPRPSEERGGYDKREDRKEASKRGDRQRRAPRVETPAPAPAPSTDVKSDTTSDTENASGQHPEA